MRRRKDGRRPGMLRHLSPLQPDQWERCLDAIESIGVEVCAQDSLRGWSVVMSPTTGRPKKIEMWWRDELGRVTRRVAVDA